MVSLAYSIPFCRIHPLTTLSYHPLLHPSSLYLLLISLPLSPFRVQLTPRPALDAQFAQFDEACDTQLPMAPRGGSLRGVSPSFTSPEPAF